MNNNVYTFGKYKGRQVTSILRENPKYFGWCKRNVKGFKFSKRDYEIYLEWLCLCQNSLQFTGYENSDNNIKFLFHQVSLGSFDDYSDNEFLTKETCKEYLNSSKEHYFRK